MTFLGQVKLVYFLWWGEVFDLRDGSLKITFSVFKVEI